MLSVAGTLRFASLTELLSVLATSGQTGVLRLGGAGEAEVWLDVGDVIYANGNQVTTFRHALETEGVLTAGQWEQAVAAAGGAATGAALAALPGVSSAAIVAVLRERTVDLLTPYIFREADLASTFEPARGHPFGSVHRVGLVATVREAVDRAVRWREVLEVVPTLAAIPQISRRIGRVTIDPDDQWILAFIDGHSSITSIVPRTGVGWLRTCSAIERLVRAGAVDLHVPETAWPPTS